MDTREKKRVTLPKEIWSMILILKYLDYCRGLIDSLESKYLFKRKCFLDSLNPLDTLNCLYHYDGFTAREVKSIFIEIIQPILDHDEYYLMDEYYKLCKNLQGVFNFIFNDMFVHCSYTNKMAVNVEIVHKLLLKYDIDLMSPGYLEYHKEMWCMILQRGKIDFLELMMSRNITPNLDVEYTYKNMTPLHYACSYFIYD